MKFDATKKDLSESLIQASKYTSMIVMATSLMVLIGWVLNIPLLQSVLPGLISMKFNTAVCFLLSAISLFLQVKHPGQESIHKFKQVIAVACAAIVLGICGLTLYEYLSGVNLGIDEFLLKEPLTGENTTTYNRGRMAWITAVDFLLLVPALINSKLKVGPVFLNRLLAIIAGSVALIPFIGYLYGMMDIAAFGIGKQINMAINTSVNFLLLSIGIALLNPNQGILKVVCSNGPGGVITQRLLPSLIITVFLSRGLIFLGEQYGLYNRYYGIALYTALVLLTFGTLILLIAKMLYQVDEERKALGEKITQSEALFRNSMEQAAIGMALLNPTGRFLRVNQALCDIVGYSQEELCQFSVRSITHPDDIEFDVDNMASMKEKTQERYYREKRYIHKDGHIVWVQITSSLMWSAQDEPLYFIAQIQDITKRKETEASYESAKQSALQASQLKSDFLANMSHEIRTPINGILGMTELALQTSLSDVQRKYLEMVYSSGESLLSIVNDILDFSKIESGKFKLDPSPFHLKAFLEETLYPFNTQIAEKNLSLNLKIDLTLSDGYLGDQLRLRQILMNLLSNAIKFTEKGSISFKISRLSDANDLEPHLICFSVEDTGIGLSEKSQENIFKPFIQADGSTARRYGGTGLGLSISKQLVELMGGEFHLKSSLGKGSEFSFTIPLKPVSEFAADEAPLLEQMIFKSELAMQPMTILIAEDNPINQAITTHILTQAGHEVFWAENGYKVLEHLEHQQFDLILMDVNMNGMDGYEATRQIRTQEQGTGRHQAILALTANAMKEGQDACFAVGMDGYLSKPFRSQQLLDEIQNLKPLIDDNPPVQGKKYSVDKIWVDEQKLMERLNGDRALLVQIVKMFENYGPGQLLNIKTAIDVGDPERLRAESHALKSAIGDLACEQAFQTALSLEMKGKSQDLKDVEGLYKTLAQEVEQMQQSLARLL